MSSGAVDDTLIAMRVGGIVVDPSSQVPVVILRGLDEPRLYLPIFIGGLEATAIATVLASVELPRPMTHDLMVSLLVHLDARVERVTVTRLDEGTFFAEIALTDAAGGAIAVDARPSDSIALALRVGAPIFVAREVIAAAGALSDAEVDDGVLIDSGGDDDEAEVGDPDEGGEDAPAQPDPRTAADADVGHGPALVDADDVRLEDLANEDFGKYKM